MQLVEERPGLPLAPSQSPPPTQWLVSLLKALSRLFTEIGYRLNRTLPKDGSEAMTAPLVLRAYTVATRPAAADYAGGVIYVSDGGAGAVIQASNGAAWVNLG